MTFKVIEPFAINLLYVDLGWGLRPVDKASENLCDFK